MDWERLSPIGHETFSPSISIIIFFTLNYIYLYDIVIYHKYISSPTMILHFMVEQRPHLGIYLSKTMATLVITVSTVYD